MKKNTNYHDKLETNPMRFENIEEKQLIHEFQHKSIDINLDRVQDKKKVNEIR